MEAEILNGSVAKMGGGTQVTSGSMAQRGFGKLLFIAHSELAPNYLKNDTLCFEVLSVV